MIIRLVRHGESTWNAQRRVQGQCDPPLSAVGREQARAIDLTGCDAVLSSDLRRTVDTARLAGREPLQDRRLREMGLGVLEGLPLAAALQRFPDHDWTDVDAAVPGGESLRDVWERLVSIDLTEYGDDVAVVSHGDTIRVARCAFAAGPVEEVETLVPANGSVTVLATRLAGPRE